MMLWRVLFLSKRALIGVIYSPPNTEKSANSMFAPNIKPAPPSPKLIPKTSFSNHSVEMAYRFLMAFFSSERRTLAPIPKALFWGSVLVHHHRSIGLSWFDSRHCHWSVLPKFNCNKYKKIFNILQGSWETWMSTNVCNWQNIPTVTS